MTATLATSEKISPTAYATGQFWFRQGLSHPAFVTPQGLRLDRYARVVISGLKLFTGISMDALMLARHCGIDARLEAAIDAGKVTQVIEIAAGLSPRGWRFRQRCGDRITYIETDLPQMAACKRELLTRGGFLSAKHRVMELDALADDGPMSLAQVVSTLDTTQGTAIVTEGLVNYFDTDTARGMWRRFARNLAGFPAGFYFSDVYPQAKQVEGLYAAFGKLLGAFVKGRLTQHFETSRDVIDEMSAAGFGNVRVFDTREIPATRDVARIKGGERVKILDAAV
jgi:O-methyltransferase involved in polyketide biosynthesis